VDYVIVFSGLAGGSSERLLAATPLLLVAQLLLLPILLARVEQAGSAALLVATARMDGSGRVCERLLLRALGRAERPAAGRRCGRWPLCGRRQGRGRAPGTAAPAVRDQARAWVSMAGMLAAVRRWPAALVEPGQRC
jgi:hypothetical protein